MKSAVWIVIGSLALIGCNNAETKTADPKPKTKAETKAGAEAKVAGAPLIIDVRSKDEWDSGHIASAVHIPHTQIGDRITEHAKSKDQKIILYCRSGGRAGKALETLKSMGYTNVENAGGYEDIKDKYK